MKSPYMVLEHISFSYHNMQAETIALSDISFYVNKGEFIAIVGPSGCGKSTLLSIIAGLLTPEEGKITFPDMKDSSKPQIGYMLQHDHLFEWRNIYQNVTLGLDICKCKTSENLEYVNEMLKDYGLWQFRHKRPSELSGGMKQRAALIRTLALKPDLLLLDEPFSALDNQTRLYVSGDICQIIRKEKKTAILITHDLAEAISLSDRIILLTNRPAKIKSQIPVKLSVTERTPLKARSAPEFNDYFNLLWKELADEDQSRTIYTTA